MTNRVILTGTITRAAQRLYRPDGTAVLEFVLRFDQAVEDHGRPESEARYRRGSEIEVVAFGELARYDLARLVPGQPIQVQGQLHQRSWKTPEGKTRTRFEIVATELKTFEDHERRKT